MEPVNYEEINYFIEQRKKAQENDTAELLTLRKSFLDMLSTLGLDSIYEIYPYENSDGMLISKELDTQYLAREANIRTKVKTETRLEIDRLPRDVANEIIIQTGVNLSKKGYTFYIFDAGGRSFHLIIYDLIQLSKYSEFRRVQAQVIFWRRFMPPGTFQFADLSVFRDEQLLPLEYAPHWKTKKPFNLILKNEGDDYAKS